MIGTIVNVGTILTGSIIGSILNRMVYMKMRCMKE